MGLVNRWRRSGLTFTAIQVLRPEPGDTLVLRTDTRFNAAEVERILSDLQKTFPEYNTAVIGPVMKLTVVRPDQLAKDRHAE